jgi:plasmid replication initiation protein
MKATEQKKHEIQRSNLLIEASYNIPSVDGYRIALIGMSNACINLLNNPDDENALTVAIKTKELQALFPSFRKAQSDIHKRIDKATDSIGRNNMVKVLNKDEGHWRKIPFIMDIEYQNSNLLLIRFNEEIRPLFNPKSEFTRYLINDTAKLRSYQQIRVYELCCQYIKVGSRTVDIPTFKKFIGIKNKTTSDLIRELNSCISQINNKTNLKVEFETLKTSRKITHIKFTFCRKDLHPLDGINQDRQISDASNTGNANDTSNTSTIKAQLIALGFKKAKLPSLLKIPAEVLLRAITATKKTKTKGFKKTMEACFFFQVGIFKSEGSGDDTNNNTKIEPIQLVHLFKDNLSIETMKDLWDEFYAQLSEGQKNAYSESNREKNTTVKEALDHDFNNKYNRWIYETKIKQG